MKIYDSRVSTRNAEGSSEVRSRRQGGTESGTQGERKSANDIRAENNELDILQRMARNAKKNGTEDDFTEEFGKTPDSVLKQKPQPIPDLPRGSPQDIPVRKKKPDTMV